MDNLVTPPYGTEVLIGNWVDRRYAFDQNGKGILPGMCGEDTCERHLSLAQDTYTDAAFKAAVALPNFSDHRNSFMRNYFTGTTSSVAFLNDAALKRNFTTTNTLLYDLLPRLDREAHAESNAAPSGIPEHRQELDMLRSYGNMTKTFSIAELSKPRKPLGEKLRLRTTYDLAFNKLPRTKMDFR